MTELLQPIGAPGLVPAGKAAADASRLTARYRSERRFKAMGLGALLLTAVFVVVLIGDIVIKSLPAFWQNSMVLDVPVAADVVDPDGKKDPAALRGADYFALARTALETSVPGIEGRVQKKQFVGLLSSGAAIDLGETIVADPDLVGQTVKTRLLLSDDADLYFKGLDKAVSKRPAKGIVTVTGTTGEVALSSTVNDFADELRLVKEALIVRAGALTKEAARLKASGHSSVEGQIKNLESDAAALIARAENPKGEEPLGHQEPSLFAEINGGLIKITKLSDTSASGEVLLPLSSTGEAASGTWNVMANAVPEGNRQLSDLEVAILDRLQAAGKIESGFNWRFFTAGDSREPELAGIRGALIGSILTLAITIALCLPVGVMAAIYLEEFAPKNRWTDLIEVNINNLAAVPSIVFGLLGLAVFLNFFGLPRSAPLVGGLVLALLVLPTIIIASRAALKAVPQSIREGALGIGASKQQAIFHHVLPLAMPGIMTGTIIGMAHALGETAPLLMIGMVAFIVDVPKSITEASTVLPVQIYLWSDLPEVAFQSKTAAAILVLLVFLFAMNGLAVLLRKKFERRW